MTDATEDAEQEYREFKARMRDTRTADAQHQAMLRSMNEPARFGDELTDVDRAAIERISNL